MTEPTTPITVHLTDEWMAYIEDEWRNIGPPQCVIREAIEAQRSRRIAKGDRVRWLHEPKVYNVEGVKDGEVWLWDDKGCIGTFALSSLARVDDEATA